MQYLFRVKMLMLSKILLNFLGYFQKKQEIKNNSLLLTINDAINITIKNVNGPQNSFKYFCLFLKK